jgi:dihydroflavonol-4-reductase
MDTKNQSSNPPSSSTGDAPENLAVLVTGGSGYLASWTIVDLLKRGYRVRTTVRDLSRSDAVRSMIASKAPTHDQLSFVEANLLDDEGWEQATAETDYVLHVASPMPVGEYRGTDLIGPAVDGTLRVLRAARAAGVRRVVLTSSANTALPAAKSGVVADESIWTEVPDTTAHAYPRSKTLAEQAAWSFANSSGLELTSVLPAFMQGPVLGGDYSGSIDVIARMLNGRLPAIPRVGWNIVDVRDVADLHLRAMTAPEAAGQRFIGGGEFLWLTDIAVILRKHLGEKAAKISIRALPNAVVRIGSLFKDEMKQMVPLLGVRQEVTSAKAERVLGWKARPAAAAIRDGASSLIDQELVQI